MRHEGIGVGMEAVEDFAELGDDLGVFTGDIEPLTVELPVP